MNILLISGHGAGDCGAVGNGYKEADLTRELVNLIAPKLRQYASVDIYDQKRNAFKDVRNGTFKVGQYDYALEIHYNAFNGTAKGTEIYVTSLEKGTGVENAIMKHLGSLYAVRGVKVKNYSVIYKIKRSGISSALLEVCFIDNKEDMQTYAKSKDKIASLIVDGIVEGFNLKKADLTQIAKEVIAGKWGNGAERKTSLEAAGYDYAAVQKRVNELMQS
jgi:N-acetylmuramoyl-L-alanine amidase